MNLQKRNISSVQENISSIQNYQGLSFLPVTFTGLADLFPQMRSWHEQFCRDTMHQLWCSMVAKYLLVMQEAWVQIRSVFYLILFHEDILGGLGSNLVFIIPFGNTSFLMEYHDWLWKCINEIQERVLANSFSGIHKSKIIFFFAVHPKDKRGRKGWNKCKTFIINVS